MNDCKERQSRISALIDGELSEDERTELLLHIAECDECSRTLAAFSAVTAALAEDEAPPQELHRRIMDAVKRESPSQKRRRGAFLALAALAACLTLVLFAGQRLLPAADENDTTLFMKNAELVSENDISSGVPEEPKGMPSDEYYNEGTVLDIAAEELCALLAPSGGTDAASADDEPSADAETMLLTAQAQDGSYVSCTVILDGERVYADFGEGPYLCSCTATELVSRLFD